MNQKTSNSTIKHKKRYRSPNGINRVYKDGHRYKLKQKIVLSDGTEVTVVGSGNTRSQCERNTKRLCEKKLAQLGESASNRELLADYCQHWIDNIKSYDGAKNKTLTSYRTALAMRIRPLTQGLDVRSVKREDIQKLYGEMQRQNLSFYMIKDVRAVICGSLDEAVDSGILTLGIGLILGAIFFILIAIPLIAFILIVQIRGCSAANAGLEYKYPLVLFRVMR